MADLKENKFDEVFRNKLSGYEETPPDFIYDKLLAHFSGRQIPNSGGSSFNRLFYFIAAALIIGVITMKIIANSDKLENPGYQKATASVYAAKVVESKAGIIKNEKKIETKNSNVSNKEFKTSNLKELNNGSIIVESSAKKKFLPAINNIENFQNSPVETKLISQSRATKDSSVNSPGNENPSKISFKVVPATCGRNNGSITTIVEGGSTNLNFSWSPFDAILNNNKTINNLYSGVYKLKISDGKQFDEVYEIFVPDSGKITANYTHSELEQTVSIPIYFKNKTICDGFPDPEAKGTTYHWSFGDGHSSVEVNPVHKYSRLGLFQVLLVAKSKYGCIDSIMISDINISPANPEAPNVFSPNGDGLNDVFQPKIKPAKEFSGIIVNYEGKEVFKWNDQNSGWNGKINNKDAATGTYYYIVSYTGTDNQKYCLKGSLFLTR